MNKLQKLRWKYINFKVNRRYHKLDKCNLPFGLFDKKREKYEWVNFLKYIDNTSGYNISKDLMDALETICKIGLTYHYNINNNKKEKNYPSHSHDFESILKALYFYPESFNIPAEFKNDYSKQELNYIEEMKKYLLFIELKDFKNSQEYSLIEEKLEKIFAKEKVILIDKIKIHCLDKKRQKINYKNKLVRCHNEREKKYQDYGHLTFSKEKITNIIENKQNFLIHYVPYFDNVQNYSTIGNKYLLKDEKFNILVSIEIIDNKILQFKDFDQSMAKEIKNFSKYKKDLKKNYIEIDKNFNDESYIIYEKIKVLEKF